MTKLVDLDAAVAALKQRLLPSGELHADFVHCVVHDCITSLRSLPAFEPDVEKAATEYSYHTTHHPIGVAMATPAWRAYCAASARAVLRAAGVLPAALDAPGAGEEGK